MAQAAIVPADTADPISNAVLTPEASLFVRQILQSALANGTAASANWRAAAQALLANVLMNDVLNEWNPNVPVDIAKAQAAADAAKRTSLPKTVQALAWHAQGLINRSNRNYQDALSAFQKAATLDPGFARGQVQLANQRVLSGGNTNQARTEIQRVIDQNPLHPASGYFYWAMGRAYFVDQDWPNAIKWLTKSVKALPTVTYNRAYLAAAKQHAGNIRGAKTIVRQLVNDPRFDQATFARIKQLNPDPKDPARKRMLDFVQPLL
jgi:tetratricopeptide (TPR) repeat protein